MKDISGILLDFMEQTYAPGLGCKAVLLAAQCAFRQLADTLQAWVFRLERNRLVPVDRVEDYDLNLKIEQEYFEACLIENADKPVCVSGYIFFPIRTGGGMLLGTAVCSTAVHLDEKTACGAMRLAKDAGLRLEACENGKQKVLHGKSTAAILSHEFKTPLTIAFASLQLLEKNIRRQSGGKAPAEEPALKYIGYIEQNLYRIQALAENLLDAEYADERALISDEREIDLVQNVEEIVQSAEPYAAMNEIRMTFVPKTEKPCRIVCSPRVPERILLNLISNALKHTPKGGECIVKIEDEADGVVIKVENEGEPIAKENFEHLFERFWRGREERNGSGLGLYLSRRLAQLQKWTISAENRTEGGVRFALHIPYGQACSSVDRLSGSAIAYQDDSLKARVRTALSGVNFPQK